MKNRKFSTITATLALLLVAGCSHAQEVKPFVHPLFSDNAVLQRDRAVPVWGWTTPQTKVTVRLDNAAVQTATADADGRWTVSLAPHAAGDGPHSLNITGADGETAARKNLLFGDVWLCSGQSNMAYDLRGALNPETEIAAANYPEIRLLRVSYAIKNAPIQSFNANWKVCSPQTVGTFSGVGYFFGRKLYKELNVPIGLIDSSWSGTPGESWVSGPALAQIPDFKAAVDAMKPDDDAQTRTANEMSAWWQTNDAGTMAHQEAPDFDDSAWKTMDLPGNWESKGFPDFDGVMWFRREINVPTAFAGRPLQLDLGTIDDNDTTYWNGAPVGADEGWTKERHYIVPGALVKAGRNVIAVRVLDVNGGGGMAGPAIAMKSGDQIVSLEGAWKFKGGPELKTLPAMPRSEEDPNKPVVLFNGKISPLLPGAIKGILWYQGESNADNMKEATQYRQILPTLVQDWRAHFGADTPFYIMQLANFHATEDQPSNNAWPNLREAQLQTARRFPNTYMTVLIDLGEQKNVHFPNKQEAGARLANNVLEHTYGRNIESSGPTLKTAKAVGDTMQLTFDHAQGLNLKGDQNRVFAIAGADLKFSWATPAVAGNMVTLTAPDVKAPLYARFGWSDFPLATLYNATGLPASPFRTDGQ